MDDLWYKDGAFYKIELRAFCDSNADGIGDLAGLTRKLPYLQELGVSTIWLQRFSPPSNSTQRSDRYRVECLPPAYGTLDDFRMCVREAHLRSMRVVLEITLDQIEYSPSSTEAGPDTRAWYLAGSVAVLGGQWKTGH